MTPAKAKKAAAEAKAKKMAAEAKKKAAARAKDDDDAIVEAVEDANLLPSPGGDLWRLLPGRHASRALVR